MEDGGAERIISNRRQGKLQVHSHPGLEIKILYYTVKYSKAHHLQRTQAGNNVRQTRELTYVTRHANTCSRL